MLSFFLLFFYRVNLEVTVGIIYSVYHFLVTLQSSKFPHILQLLSSEYNICKITKFKNLRTSYFRTTDRFT